MILRRCDGKSESSLIYGINPVRGFNPHWSTGFGQRRLKLLRIENRLYRQFSMKQAWTAGIAVITNKIANQKTLEPLPVNIFMIRSF